MKQNLRTTTDWILHHEGGYVNHPDDPGGATNYGVIQRTYDGYRLRIGQPKKSVRHIDMEEIYAIYKQQYWDKVWGDDLPSGLDYAMYDFAINSGPGRAVKFVQKIVGTSVDGQMGNMTFGAISEYSDIEELIQRLCRDRWAWLKRLRHYKTFGRGWTRRVMGTTIQGVQANSENHDEGVIDRATWLWRSENAKDITLKPTPKPPLKIADGAGARTDGEEADLKTSAKVKESINLPNAAKTVAGAVPPAIGAAAVVPEGPLQYAIAVAIVIVVVFVGLIAYRRLR